MKEEFLWYLWSNKLIKQPIITAEGEPFLIMEPGILNTNAGPDFFNAKVKIGSTIWAGNVEVHVKASDWNKHGHQYDRKYNNIILHLVYENDVHIVNSKGKSIPTLELRNGFDEKIYFRYRDFRESRWWIPCANLIGKTDKFIARSWLKKIRNEIILFKADAIRKILIMNNHDWNQTLYTVLATGFGFHVNAIGFETLAKSLPYQIILENKNDLITVEALLFGQAGLLQDLKGDYPAKLYSRYQQIKKSHLLEPMDPKLWNFLRLRPSNFPTIRIAQFASILHQSSDLYKELININEKNELFDFFSIQCSNFWTNHYTFYKTSKQQVKKLGKEAIISLVINIIVPLKYLHGRLHSEDDFLEKSVHILQRLPSENNKIVRKFHALGLQINNASDSQALLFLKKQYCDHKKCLECRIGQHLING